VRTGVETSDVDGVMGGRLDDFMTEFLRFKQVREAEEAAAISGGGV
jgi:hypothetical protein